MRYNEVLLHNPFPDIFEVNALTGSNIEFGICATFPATIITAKVSPIALPIPNITAVIIPGIAQGIKHFL